MDNELQEFELDDRRSFVAAASSIVRLDEALLSDPKAAGTYLPGARRREAAAIASLEGLLIRQESLCRLLGDRDITNVERGVRLAADVHDALGMVSIWPESGPDQANIVSLFMASDASSGRLIRPDVQWSIEEDSSWLAEELSGFSETPEPWTAAETVRRIWCSGRFLGTARRMAMIAASWVVPKGFGCRWPRYGAAAEVRKDPDGFRDASQDKDKWSVRFATALAEGYGSERLRLGDALASRTSLLALCPPGRASSSIVPALDFLFSNPVFTAKQFAESLGLTARGAKVVLDKMVETNVVEADPASRNRKYACRRTM